MITFSPEAIEKIIGDIKSKPNVRGVTVVNTEDVVIIRGTVTEEGQGRVEGILAHLQKAKKR